MQLKLKYLKKIPQVRIPPALKNRRVQLGCALALLLITTGISLLKLKQTAQIASEQATQIKLLNEEKTAMDKELASLKAQNAALTPPDETAPRKPVNPVESLYSPEITTSNNNQSAMDALKRRYEEIFVTYFFLKKCNKINPIDFHIITSALSQEMASINAPGRLQHDIVTSAQGSYKEMYSKTVCDSQTVDALSAQYTSYITSLSSNFNLK